MDFPRPKRRLGSIILPQGASAALSARVQHLEDVDAIEKLQSRYARYLFTQRYDRIFDERYAHDSLDVSV